MNENLYTELQRGVHATLETYSNVHRGSGHFSIVTTELFEEARKIVLEYLGLSKRGYVVIFCAPRRANKLKSLIYPNRYHCLSSQDIGLPLGIRALVVKKGSLPKGVPCETGGGSARLVSPGWVIWTKGGGKFESGTPAIVNAIAFAKALLLIREFGEDIFRQEGSGSLSASNILFNDKLEEYSGKRLLDELRNTLIGKDIHVPTVEGSVPFVNLDNGASTPTFTPIWDAVWQTWRQPAEVQKQIVDQTRLICANFLGAPEAGYDIIFTSNTTESVNLTAESLGRTSGQDIEPVVLNTIMEHNSNELPWRYIPGVSMIRMTVDDEGFVDLKALEGILSDYNKEEKHGKQRIRLFAITGASNVMGSYNDLSEISRIAHSYGVLLAVDAAQLVAHRKLNMEQSGIDYLFFSAHKMYAPFGSGALVVRRGLLNFSAAEREAIDASAEENTGGIAALGKAMVLLQRVGFDLIREEEKALTKLLLDGLKKIPGLPIFGVQEQNSPRFDQKGGVVVFGFKHMVSYNVAKKLALWGGIGTRYGCHCAHMMIKRLTKTPTWAEWIQGAIVTALPHFELPGVVRISFGIENQKEDVEKAIRILGFIASETKEGKAQGISPMPEKLIRFTQKEVKKQVKEFTQAASERVYTQAK